eukprot:TRINITY_DN4610_c0_g1_i2.p1 TRINITY_DN4610_c0_g1~~TRINITY_DN4610_c0_g1_i2.p1  ORF type:complete len:321 (-),score=38.31 TRINITY_DN4610_c0_g1_i2:468-1430(-)
MDLVHQYLQALPQVSVEDLYQDEDTILTIIESLPSLAQQCCFRMVCLGQRVVSRSQVLTWVGTSATCKRKLAHALDKLIALRLVVRVGQGISLDTSARHTLVRMLSSPREPAHDSQPPHGTSQGRWERLLLFLATGSTAEWDPPEVLINVLTRNGLFRRLSDDGSSDTSSSSSMSSSEGESIGEVTGHGFNFLLQSTQTQLWRFCLAYVAGCPHPEQVLRLLFALSCARVLRLADLSSAQVHAALCRKQRCFSWRPSLCCTRLGSCVLLTQSCAAPGLPSSSGATPVAPQRQQCWWSRTFECACEGTAGCWCVWPRCSGW